MPYTSRGHKMNKRTNSASKKISKFIRKVANSRSSSLSSSRNSTVAMSQSGAVSLAATRRSVGTNKALKLWSSISVPAGMPARVETVLLTTMEFYNAVGTLTAAAGNYLDVLANSVYQPFNTTYAPTTGTGTASFAQNASLIQGYAITNNPLGYTEFANVYDFYRVVRYRMEITVVPQNVGDSVRLVVVPLGGEEIPSASAGNVNLRVMEGQENSRSKTCTQGCSALDNTIIIEGCPYKDIGQERDQYMSGSQTSVSAQISASPYGDYVGVYSQQVNGANNASVVSYQIKLYQVVVFSSINAQLS